MDKKKLELIAIPVLAVTLVLAVVSSFRKGSQSGPGARSAREAAPIKTQAVEGAAAVGAMPEKRFPLCELEWGRDPFTTHNIAGQGGGIAQNLNLMGISWSSKKGAYSAIINNEIVTVGSRIGKFTVKDIQKDRVTVSDEEKTCDLLLNP